MRWIPVTERLPEPSEYPFKEALVWVAYPDGDGRVMVADVRSRFSRRNMDYSELVDVNGFNFQWGGGDNDRTWPAETGFGGEGGYGGPDDGEDRVTHWMSLPEAP
jgi:hypothetical protein